MARKTVTEQLISAIKSSAYSRAEIARGTDVTEGQISRLVRGERGITSETFDALCKFLDLELCRRED